MAEADILLLQIELTSLIWNILFTWVGTTTGMVVAAYFVAVRFSTILITGMLLLYSLFSVACIGQLIRGWGRMAAIGRDLHSLKEQGIALSHSSQTLMQNIDSEVLRMVVIPTILAIFFLSIGYVVYCFRKGGN